MNQIPAEKLKSLMRGFLEALEEADVDKALSFLTDDVTYVTPVGTFEGQEAVRRYFAWMTETMPDLEIVPTGIDIVTAGDRAAYEHILKGTIRGEKAEWLAMCAYEFSGEKIRALRTVFDRLDIVEQTAKGWLSEQLVAQIVKQTKRGLD